MGKRFQNGIVILPENLKVLRTMTAEEVGEVMKALIEHAFGHDLEDWEFASSEKVVFTYKVLEIQVDNTEDARIARAWKGRPYEKR